MSHELLTIDEHMKLVQLQPEQADILFELTDRNREYLGQFLPWPAHVKSVEDSRKHIEETIQKRIENSSYTYGIEVDGVIAGDISIRNLNEAEKTPEIGYWMSPIYAGKGLMTKSVQALTDYGLGSLGLEKIVIRAEPTNVGSNKVAEKAGYIQEGKDIEHDKTLNVWSISNPV